MQSAHKLTQVCQAWWNALKEPGDSDQEPFAREFLGLLGWEEMTFINTMSGDSQLSNVSFLLEGESGTTVAAHFVLPGILEPPSAMIERGMDFCQCTRLLVNGTRRLAFDYAFVTDMNRCYLYDARTDELLLHSDSIEFFGRDMAGALTRDNVNEDGLDDVRRNPRSVLARQLRQWRQRWIDTFMAETHQDEESVQLILDRLLVLRYLFDHDVMKRPNWRLRKRFSDVVECAFTPHPLGCGTALTTLFHDIWFEWQAEMFRPQPAVDYVLERDETAAQLLREFTLLSKTKFDMGAILESFNYGDAMEKARVRLVPEPDEERARFLARQTLESLEAIRVEIDVVDEGYRAILYWFDKILSVYDRLGAEFPGNAEPRRQAGRDVDLFAWSELDATQPEPARDRIQYAVERGLVVYSNSPRQYRTARLLLYLHVIAAYAASGEPFGMFPQIEECIQSRPKQLDSEKLRRQSAARGEDRYGAYHAI